MASKSSPGQSYASESFGDEIPEVKLNKGDIAIFGHTVDGKLGGKTTSVNQKTGYPAKQ